RKTEGPLFCYLLRCMAHDPKVAEAFVIEDDTEEEEFDLNTSPARLKSLLESGPAKKSGKSPTKKSSKSKNGTTGKTKKKTKKSNTASSH
ncbi:MAG: hypothetical protein KDA84_28430, partial [Planctomycetaceae bacterium]|nr:hypothetical protein [Planctomycetaceae bacterium]